MHSWAWLIGKTYIFREQHTLKALMEHWIYIVRVIDERIVAEIKVSLAVLSLTWTSNYCEYEDAIPSIKSSSTLKTGTHFGIHKGHCMYSL
jgi:hypothetical protein